jgi:hypothetical protein
LPKLTRSANSIGFAQPRGQKVDDPVRFGQLEQVLKTASPF